MPFFQSNERFKVKDGLALFFGNRYPLTSFITVPCIRLIIKLPFSIDTIFSVMLFTNYFQIDKIKDTESHSMKTSAFT